MRTYLNLILLLCAFMCSECYVAFSYSKKRIEKYKQELFTKHINDIINNNTINVLKSDSLQKCTFCYKLCPYLDFFYDIPSNVHYDVSSEIFSDVSSEIFSDASSEIFSDASSEFNDMEIQYFINKYKEIIYIPENFYLTYRENVHINPTSNDIHMYYTEFCSIDEQKSVPFYGYVFWILVVYLFILA